MSDQHPAVARGAAFLDRTRPGWALSWQPGRPWQWAGWVSRFGIRAIGEVDSLLLNKSRQHGFMIARGADPTSAWSALDEAWKREIEARRPETGAPDVQPA